jgi:type II secretory ATPase GspE/PulE/Tfp pilus assembly ATPase PilB-like protein
VKVNVLKDYRLIPLEEDEKRLKLLAPEGYDFFLLEELRFLLEKEIDVVFVDENTFAQELQRPKRRWWWKERKVKKKP